MDFPFITWILWAIVLLIGAAYPEEKSVKRPTKSIKNRLFGIWWIIMLIYAILWYIIFWGSIFFIILEILIVISCALMMLNTNDKFDTSVIGISWIILIIWSMYLFQWYTTIIFVLWLALLGLWYAFNMGSLRRDLMLTFGSILIAIFSYIEASRIFFWLNIFFALFSLYYTIKRLRSKKNKKMY
jgi:hypothetical protein